MRFQKGSEAVFLTGGGGFIGSNLICRLLAEGKRVVSLCLPGERLCLPLLLPKEKDRIIRSGVDDMLTIMDMWDGQAAPDQGDGEDVQAAPDEGDGQDVQAAPDEGDGQDVQTAPDNQNTPPMEWRVLFVEVDIRDRASLGTFFRNSLAMGLRYSYVVHLAACSTVQQAANDEQAAWAVNVDGTRNLLDLLKLYCIRGREKWRGPAVPVQFQVESQAESRVASKAGLSGCKGWKLKGFIYASTDKIYGEGGEVSYKEDHPLAPEFPYEKSKAEADRMVREQYRQSGLPAVVVRFCNVYGPGDLHISRLVPGSLYRLQMQKPVLLKMYRDSSGAPRGYRRDMIYVGDIVEAILLLMRRLEAYGAEPSARQSLPLYGEAFNLGTEHCYWVEDIVRKLWEIRECLHSKPENGEIEADSRGDRQFQPQIETVSAGEIREQCMSYQKAEQTFGFRPRTGLEEGLAETVRWYDGGEIWDERRD